MSAVAIFSDLILIIFTCRVVSASLCQLNASSAETIVHTFGLYEKEWKQWYDPIGPNRKSHTLTKMFVTSWEEFYKSRKLNQQLSIKGDPENMFFAQMPNDIVGSQTATLEKLVEYNLARVYRRFKYPNDFLANAVLINVDVILEQPTIFFPNYYTSPQLYDPSKDVLCPTKGAQINLECFLSWQPWSCPRVCENEESSKQVTRSRMGYISFKKRNVLNPIGLDCTERYGNSNPEFGICLGVDIIFSIHPYDTQGIPVYSSYWDLYSISGYRYQILNHFKVPSQTEYFEVKLVSCAEMTECENVPGYRDEVTIAPLMYTETMPPVTETPEMSTECAKDLFKHADIFVPKKTSFVQLYKGKSYRFYCGQTVNENQKSKISWRLGVSKTVAPHCSSSSPVFQEKNELHVHDASISEIYACELEHQGKKILYGKIQVTYVEPIDWHSSILSAVGICLIVLISCSACLWCGRGVKNVTKTVANVAVEGGVMAADFYLMGAAGQVMEGRKAAEQEKERQILAKEDEMARKAIDDALKKRKKKAKE